MHMLMAVSGGVAGRSSCCITPTGPYSSEQFQPLMVDSGIVCSMSRSGNVWDNTATESLYSLPNTERTACRTKNEASASDYIERFLRSGLIRRWDISAQLSSSAR